MNTGDKVVFSHAGLLTTVLFKLGKDESAHQGMEGSIAVCATVINWLKNNLKIIKSSEEINKMAQSVESSKNLVFIPAFNGLYAPYWRKDIRGTLFNITQQHTDAHLCRSALESIALQVNDLITIMASESQANTTNFNVDGGVTNSDFLMQLQADISNVKVRRPYQIETTSLGAAIGAKKFIEGVDLETISSGIQ